MPDGTSTKERTITRECTRCGGEVVLTVPPNLRVRGIAATIGVLCTTCEKAEKAEEAMRETTQRFEKLRGLSGLPEELRDLSWKDMDTSDPERSAVVEDAYRWALGEFRMLVLAGPVGTGKTRLAATAANERLRRLKPVRWLSVPRMIVMMNSDFGSEEKREAEVILTGDGPLILDDLDKVQASTSILSRLYLAIDTRYQAGSPLLVTTNLTRSELQDRFGDAITSRLLGEKAHFHVLGGADRRVAA